MPDVNISKYQPREAKGLGGALYVLSSVSCCLQKSTLGVSKLSKYKV